METQNETVEVVTTRSVGVRYGLFMGGTGILAFLIIALTEMKPDGPGRWIGVAFSIVLLYLAHKYFKENGDGYMTIGQGVGIGFWAGLVSSVISSVFTFVYIKFVDSSFVDRIREAQEQAMQEKGLSDEQIEQAMKFASMFISPTALLLFGLFFGILGSIVISLIISFFTQKKNPDAIPN